MLPTHVPNAYGAFNQTSTWTSSPMLHGQSLQPTQTPPGFSPSASQTRNAKKSKQPQQGRRLVPLTREQIADRIRKEQAARNKKNAQPEQNLDETESLAPVHTAMDQWAWSDVLEPFDLRTYFATVLPASQPAVPEPELQACTADTCFAASDIQAGAVGSVKAYAEMHGFDVQISPALEERLQSGDQSLDDVIVLMGDSNHLDEDLQRRMYGVVLSGLTAAGKNVKDAQAMLLVEGSGNCEEFFRNVPAWVHNHIPDENCVDIDTARSSDLEKAADFVAEISYHFLNDLGMKGLPSPYSMQTMYRYLQTNHAAIAKAAKRKGKSGILQRLEQEWTSFKLQVQQANGQREAAQLRHMLTSSQTHPGVPKFADIGSTHTEAHYPALVEAGMAVMYLKNRPA